MCGDEKGAPAGTLYSTDGKAIQKILDETRRLGYDSSGMGAGYVPLSTNAYTCHMVPLSKQKTRQSDVCQDQVGSLIHPKGEF
jgi:hypothetical protein